MAVNTSIVDLLNSKGQASDYNSRAQLYKTSGINMGNYVGSAEQNIALMKFVNGGNSNPSPQAGSMQQTTSTPAASPTPFTDFAKGTIEKLTASTDEWNKKLGDSRQKLIDFYNNLEKPVDRFNRISKEQGVQEQTDLVNSLTKNVMDTEDIIEGLDDSVSERSKDFMITEGDRVGILAREREPHQQTLTKLLRSKQYEEVGLANKQQLVRDLVSMSLQGDQMRAKPLELGVDYTEADRKVAQDLLRDVLDVSTKAFEADTKRAWDLEDDARNYNQSVALENLSSKNSLSRSIALKKMDEEDKKKEVATDKAWNEIVGRSKTEGEVWKKINEGQSTLASQGVDIDEMWRRYTELLAKVGQDGNVRSSSDNLDYSQFLNQ